VSDCWNSSGRGMERGADKLSRKKADVFKLLKSLFPETWDDSTMFDDSKTEIALDTAFHKKEELQKRLDSFLEGEPRYSIEELGKISDSESIDYYQFRWLLEWIEKNQTKVKQILEGK